jgi:putative salt-induced outer membrane protein
MRMSFAAIAVSVIAGGAVQAAPLPSAVEAMIRAAGPSDDLQAVVKAAKATNPNSLAEIDALVDAIKSDAAASREERLAQAGVFDAWSGSGLAGFTRTTGNTSDIGLSAGLNLEKDGLRFRHKLRATADRQSTGGVLTRNKYLAGYEMNLKFSQRLYAYGSFTWDKDTFAGIGRRFSESAGAGYSLLDTTTMKLDLSAGPAFRQTRYIAALPENITTLRAGLDYSWKMFDAVTLIEKAEYFVNSEIKSTTALSIPVRNALSAQLAFEYDRQDKPQPGRKQTDTATRVGLVYSF